MAGHNKWTQIKRQKAAVDGKKSKLFSILARNITMEAKRVNGDKASASLRTIIEKARAANMPSDNIDRAMAKATGAGAENFEEVIYEAYLPVRQAGGPGGVAIIIEGITDSKNRTSQEIKHLLSLHETSLGGSGSVTWAFTKSPTGDWKPNNFLEISDKATMQALVNLIDALENHADIKRVSVNVELPENS